jgi:hypothetical protein
LANSEAATSLLYLLLSVNLLLYFYFVPSLSSCAYALFARQEITTGTHDAIQINGTNGRQGAADYKDVLDDSSDIQEITYSNDGDMLNATLWLKGPIHSIPSKYGANTVVYGVLVDIDNNPTTGKFGVDYQKEIRWTNKTGNWTSYLYEYSSPLDYRILNQESNESDFFLDNKTFAVVSVDLKSLTSPTVFRVLYYTIVIYNNSKIILDFSNWIDIPPPLYVFSSTPSPIVVRQGEQKKVGVQLISSTGTLTNVSDYHPLVNNSAVILEYIPNIVNQNQSGFSPANFIVKVPQGPPVGLYVIPVLAKISTGSIFPTNFIQIGNQNVSVTNHGFPTTTANMTISVIEAPTISEQIKEFWSVYGAIIAIVGAGLAGGLSTYLFDYLKNRKKKVV